VVPDLPREELVPRELADLLPPREPELDRDPLARDEPVPEELLRVLLVRDPPPA
jgi:hypothetical protein